jgi:nucleoredoxin
MLLRLFVFTFFTIVTARAEVPTVTSELNGKLVALKNKLTQPVSDAAVSHAKYIAFYYSAGWCGPCHKFTPDLVRFYNEMKPKHPEFEVVLISADNSSTDMQNYMAEMSMPWPALRWDAVKWSKAEKLGGAGIPSLVVVDDQGKVVSSSYDGKRYLGPHKVLDDLRNLLSQNQTTIAAATSSASAPPVAARGATPPSPSGTKWDEIFKKRSP